MSERFSFRLKAGRPGSPAVYTPEAAEHLASSQFLVNRGAKEPCYGKVVAAEVVDEGAAVEITVEVPDGTLPPQSLAGYSIGGD